MQANARRVAVILNHWSFQERTDQVYRLLCDLAQDLLLWGRFFNNPVPIIKEYGLFVPESIIQANLHFRKKPPARLFSSMLDWAAFDDKYGPRFWSATNLSFSLSLRLYGLGLCGETVL